MKSSFSDPVHTSSLKSDAHGTKSGAGTRRLLLSSALVAAATISARLKNAYAEDSSGANHKADDPLPMEAVQVNNLLFPGFRQAFIKTQGVNVAGTQASGATINTLIGGKGPPTAAPARPS